MPVQMALTLKIKRINSDAVLPKFAKKGDAGFDLFSVVTIKIKPGERVQVPTGLEMEIPKNHVGLIWDKSGISHKNGLKTLGGVIDSGYRGEILIGITNLSKKSFVFKKGEKVAQMIIQKHEHILIKEVKKLSETERGKTGFGSSGKK